jgi:predicted oxidoreductase
MPGTFWPFMFTGILWIKMPACGFRGAGFAIFGGWLAASFGMNMSARQLVSFIEEHLDLGVTTVDHADIYGGYQCEAAFGEALKLAPHLRERMEIVSKCGIATTAREENVIGHYITDRDHIIKSAEQSLINLATDHLDLLLIHRPDPLMDADEVADAFKHLHQSGKVRHFGVSNFTPAQFALLQSRLPFTLATNQVEISPVHQPLLLDGTLDQLQQLRVRPMAWSCLGGGRLFNDDYFQTLRDELAVVAEELNAGSIEQVVYAWVLRLPSQPLPIIGSGKIERVRARLSQIRCNSSSVAASVNAAQATLKQTQWQLAQTEIRAPVSGWVTNLTTRIGDYADTGKPLFALVDSHSFYVIGYFEETKLSHIREGAPAQITLYSDNKTLRGHVSSIGRAIYDQSVESDSSLIPDVKPNVPWVRLAQRVPVRFALDKVPGDVTLVSGTTCSIAVGQ